MSNISNKIKLGADQLTFEGEGGGGGVGGGGGGGGGVIYCWQGIFFLGSLCARFFFYPITMYDFFLLHFLSQHFFFNS
jgi:hypothetical protein